MTTFSATPPASSSVGTGPTRHYIDVRVTASNPGDLAAFIAVCKSVESLGKVGASRTVHVPVDGDGSADLRFDFGDTDTSGVDSAWSDADDDGEGVTIGIGE